MNDTETLTLPISGMTCGHCIAAVDQALQSVPGISRGQVALGSATIAVAPGHDANAVRAAAVRAIEGAGYDAGPSVARAHLPAASSCCSTRKS